MFELNHFNATKGIQLLYRSVKLIIIAQILENGLKKVKDGLLFDKKLQVCSWASMVECD
jgi:hypothetical protein